MGALPMHEIAPIPELPPREQRPGWVDALLEIVAAQREQIYRLREENQALKDEIARLKKQQPKPKIEPSRLGDSKRDKRKAKRKRKRGNKRQVDQTVIVKADNVPEGSRFKGYSDYWVQELVIRSQNTLYRVDTMNDTFA